MRVFILGLDGLEYDLAVKYQNLRQAEYCRVDNSGTDTWTPLCWGCILTGLPPDELKPMLVRRAMRDVDGNVRDVVVLPEHVETIFDHEPRHVMLFIPCINPHPAYWCRRHTQLLADSFNDIYKRISYEVECLKLLNQQYNEVLRFIDGDWRLFMVHFNNPDMYSHRFICNDDKMGRFYSRLDEMVGWLWSRLGDDVARVIVSDHGFTCIDGKIPNHSDYAFYSCNIRLGIKCLRLWDMKDLILKLLKL